MKMIFISKTYNILASGRPILLISESGTEIHRLVTKNDIGWVVEPDDIKGFIDIIKYITTNPQIIKKKGVKSRKLALRNYNKQKTLNRYKTTLSLN